MKLFFIFLVSFTVQASGPGANDAYIMYLLEQRFNKDQNRFMYDSEPKPEPEIFVIDTTEPKKLEVITDPYRDLSYEPEVYYIDNEKLMKLKLD